MDKLEKIRQILTTLPGPLFGANLYDKREVAAASRVIANKSPFRYYGPHCTNEAELFEAECCSYFGSRYAHTTNSGTGALIAALHALDVGPGDEVIVPGYLWISDCNAVVLRGAIPVMGEIDATLNLDPADMRRKINRRTKCIIAIHMAGAPADIDVIKKVGDEHGIPTIEDFSQCVGGAVAGRKVGTIGNIGIASLQLNKMITCGEGGLILCNDEGYYAGVLARTDQGPSRAYGVAASSPADLNLTIGEGRRFNEISAAIMRVQLERLPEMLKRLREVSKYMKGQLHNWGNFTFRRSVDEDGETGSTMALIFDSLSERRRFQDASARLFPLGELQTVALVDTGCHVYYNCDTLVQKIPALPGGFPWNLPENSSTTDYSYGKGLLLCTDSLIERTVSVSIPPDITEVQVDAWVAGFRAVFDELKNG
jgi:dTDP-4-amino-4,6-dideoxygalactose transaminase